MILRVLIFVQRNNVSVTKSFKCPGRLFRKVDRRLNTEIQELSVWIALYVFCQVWGFLLHEEILLRQNTNSRGKSLCICNTGVLNYYFKVAQVVVLLTAIAWFLLRQKKKMHVRNIVIDFSRKWHSHEKLLLKTVITILDRFSHQISCNACSRRKHYKISLDEEFFTLYSVFKLFWGHFQI